MEGKAVSKARLYQLRDEFLRQLSIVSIKILPGSLGEENRDWGGLLQYTGSYRSTPYHRLFNSPISEGAIVGTAIGYGMCVTCDRGDHVL